MNNKPTKKQWIAFNFDQKQLVSKEVTPKEKSLKETKSVTTKTKFKEQSKNIKFFDILEPKKVEDLAVHPKKIIELQTWLESNVVYVKERKGTSFLLITGPTGSGKTTSLKVVCKSLNIDVDEWVNPIDKEQEFSKGQTARLLEFLTEVKYPCLFSTSSNNKKISLIEDFPNILLKNPQEFCNIMESCVLNGTSAVVFICTDVNSNNLNMTKNLFTQEIIDQYHIHNISFNACATTILKNALKRAQSIVKENLKVLKLPGQHVVDAIVASSMGDIRCAVNQYYFAALKGTDDLPTILKQEKEKPGQKRKRSSKTTSLKGMIKDETLGLFHSLGRVLNPKRAEVNGSLRLQCNLNSLIDEFSTQPSIFNAFLHENYLKYFGDIDDIMEAAQNLSLAQTFMENWTERDETLIVALWISVLGLMIFNRHKVSKWTQIRAPKKIFKVIDKNEATRDLNLTDRCYYNLITKTETFHRFRYHK